MKKTMTSILALGLALSCAACAGPGSVGETIDPSKKQIYIAIGDDGVGKDFLYELKADYEAKNSDVQVIINDRSAELDSQSFKYVQSGTEDIFYMNAGDVNAMGGNGEVAQYMKYMLDVTALTDNKAYDSDGEYVGKGKGTKSLGDKMKAQPTNYNLLNFGTEATPKFNALPWFNAVYGAWYDIDLFEEEGLYSLDAYKGLDGIVASGDESYGPDGKANTYDDGLPSTWEDMKVLMDEMASKGIRPFTFSGMHSWMRDYWLDVVFMNYEGAEDYALAYTFEGTDSDFGAITKENGYQLVKQQGRLAQALVAEKIATPNASGKQMYTSGSLKTTQTHLQAQTEYLDSVTTEYRSAFLIDGNWWEYEARATFDEMAKQNKKFARGTRRFGYFPIPRFVGTTGLKDQENTTQYVQNISSYVIVANANTKQKELVEDFLLFSHSETALRNFTKTTNLFCPYEYDMDNDLDSLSPLAKSVYNMVNSNDVEFYYRNEEVLASTGKMDLAANCLRINHSAFFNNWTLTTIENSNYNDLIRDMAFNDSLNAQAWYDGLGSNYTQAKWNNYFDL